MVFFLIDLFKDEHSIPLTELEKRLETSAKNGLSKSQIDAKL